MSVITHSWPWVVYLYKQLLEEWFNILKYPVTITLMNEKIIIEEKIIRTQNIFIKSLV